MDPLAGLKKSRFRFSDDYDLHLAKKVLGQNPYEDPHRLNLIQVHMLQITGKQVTIRTPKYRILNFVKKQMEKNQKNEGKLIKTRNNFSTLLKLNQTKLLCDGCDDEFETTKLLNAHKRKNCPFLIPLKDLVNNQKIQIESVKIIKQNILPKELKCKKCDMVFLKNKEFDLHKKAHREPESEIEFTIEFDDFLELYTCNLCSAGFREKDLAESHLESHFYQCPHCEQTFGNLRLLFSHQIEHVKNGTVDCPLCSYKGSNITKLKYHCNSIHIPTYVCKTCNKICGAANKLKLHELTHIKSNPQTCLVCSREFATSQLLLSHQIRFHRVTFEKCEAAYQCTYCKVKYNTIGFLNLHLQRAHKHKGVKAPRKDPGKFLCDTCGQGFKSITHLKKHIHNAHTDLKPFICTQCGKAFKHNFSLTYHQRIHTGERPYSCEYCGKSFRQHTPFRVHIRTHTGEKPYTCQFCDKGFTTHQGLKLHVKNNNCTANLEVAKFYT